MSDFWDVKRPTTHMRKLCKELGPEYRIRVIDLEQVIYRDFGNGYNLEISGVNTTSEKKRATLYMWWGERVIAKKIKDVPQSEIGKRADELCELSKKLVETNFDPEQLFRTKKLPF